MILEEKLFNNKLLTEKFSDSMPKWLQNRLLYTKTRRDPIQRDKYRNMGFDMDSETSPSYASRGSHESIYNLFLNHGIDLDSAEFVSGDIPTSSRDPRLKEPNIPIFLLQGTDSRGRERSQVYAKGINDDELFEFNEDPYTDKKLGYVSMKQLLDKCTAFCYLNREDSNNYKTREKKRERTAFKDYVIRKNPTYLRYPKEKQSRYNNYDKSGYILDPSILKDRLAEYKAGNASKVIDKLYRRISNIKDDFAQIYLNTDINSINNDQDFRDIFNDSYRGLNSQLMDIVRAYNNFVSRTNDILNDDSLDEKTKKDDIIRYFQYNYNDIDSAINKLEKRAERVLSVDLDWD